jgi:lipopolysaccharide export LptBFGC system permease protein LptF
VRILTRYILGEILSHTLIGCVIFTFILFMKELPKVLEMVVRNSSTFTSVVEVVLFMLPNFFKVTIPMAVLVGVLLHHGVGQGPCLAGILRDSTPRL